MIPQYEEALETFVREELLHGRTMPDDRDHDLLSAGIVDSLGILRLAAFIEEQFGVKVFDEDVVFENFRSIRAMAAYIAGRTAAA